MTDRPVATRARDWWSSHLLLDWVIAVLICVLYLWVKSDVGVDSLSITKRRDLYLALAGISGSLLGFAIAAIAILVGLSGPRMRFLRKTEWSETINSVFSGSVRVLALTTTLLVVAYVLDSANGSVWPLITVFAAALAIARLSRLAWLLHKLVDLSDSGKTAEGST